ncbi:SLC13 family permease [Streptomyces sp. TP-A0874]|uniref:SLC13 family permease n=1 Tax=Streptomyces sp. TP-A0874 TaxID=549819 RepID=UPI0008534B38|nr:SLC13 family permease [Streptomyces sp. TP-A0874]
MSAELISILVLVVVFVVATTRSINMGALSFAAAFGVGGLVAGFDADEIFAGFPGSLFVVLVGVTYLFAIARANGTTDWLVRTALRLVRGRVALIPWVMFAISALLTAIGAVSPAAVAIVAPIALSFAARYGISPLLMGAMVVHGSQGGGFSPISIYGSIVNGIVEKEKLPGSPIVLFLGSLVVNLLIAGVVFVVCGGLKLSGRGDGDTAATSVETEEERAAGALTAARAATLTGLAALVLAVLVFDLDAGLTAITLAVLLSLFWPADSKKAVNQITWPTVLLICGVLTYVGVLEEMGTIEYAGNAVSDIGIPLLGALMICYIGAIVSAFASSVGIMGALIPLAVPFLAQGEIGAIGMITALAVSATVVDVSPFSTNGALVLANAPDVDRDRFFRQLMAYGGIVTAAVPAAVWLVLVVPGLG